jgi:translation initiation factor 2B subunit (eIF-2B alpha/beta/delta family)
MSQIPEEFREAVAAIGADRESGATTLVLRGVELLRRAAEERRSLRRVAVSLCRAQPSMAGFRTAAKLALSAEDPVRALDELFRRIERAPSSIARMAAPLIRLRVSTRTLRVVTCSRSAVVERTLLEIARTEALEVICAESRPGREGVRLAEELARQGLIVELYSDAAVGGTVRGADALIVGADAVTATGFINKVGTAGLAALAAVHRIPVFVLAGREKILPDRVFRRLALNGGPAAELEESSAYRTLNPYFERIEAIAGDQLITETGALAFPDTDAASLWAGRI